MPMVVEDTANVELSDKELSDILEEVLLNCDDVRILDLSGNKAIRLGNSISKFRNVTNLLLNRCALSGMPDEISELKKLEVLELSGNDFSGGLKQEIGRLGRLKKLCLSSCKLASFPDWIGDLEQLEDLELSENDFSGGLSLALGRLGQLKKLALRLCKLAKLPDSIGDLEQLEDLELTGNDFYGGLNPALGRLGRLKQLYLSACKLASLPGWIGDLEQLEDLELSGSDFYSGLHPALGRLKRLKTLDISACKLASLPDWIGDLEQLEDLELSGNDFYGGLNPALGRLGRLKKLNISECMLASLPDWIGYLEQLEDLELWGNVFYGVLNPALGRLGRLKKLSLYWCNVASLPDWIGDLEHLEDLALSGNEFSGGLNPALGRLEHLKNLEINGCKLACPPDWIGDLEQLECLELSGSDFSGGLRPSIGRLGRLKRLDISACKLASLPDWIGDLEQLEDLELWGNLFYSGLNPALARLGRLKKLSLYSCNVASLHDWIGDLEQLENLDLSENDFSSGLNQALRRLGRLKQLVLNTCKLASLPDWIGDLDQLKNLDLSENHFSSGLNEALRRLGRLKKLGLSACKLACLPDWIGDLEQLEDLRLSENDFSSGLSLALGRLGQLKKLALRLCKLEKLPDSIGYLAQLEDLELSVNDFSGGLNPALGRLGRLKKLDLRACKLACLPDWFGDLQELEDLELSGSDFSGGINQALGQLVRLKRLDLSSCKLASLPDWIGDLEQLEDLELSRSDFSIDLNPAIGRLGRLKKLGLYSCHLESLPAWIGDLEQIENLDFSGNDFCGGLNPALRRLRRLQALGLNSCKLASLPDWIGCLEQLKTLRMNNNRLEDYPRCTLRLKKLYELDVSNDFNNTSGNRIKYLPVELASTTIVNLNLRGNPIREPPEEIWSQGTNAIKSFMRAIIPGGEVMHADTLNMIGDTGAGKTSLAQSMIAKSPRATAEADRTHVLQQCRMKIDERLGQSVIINDFGGHEIYHCVMPIFLPANGLLVLVYNMIDKDQAQTVKKWMLTALAKSKVIRMIIVGTHADLVTSSEQLSALEERMAKFSSEILLSAVKEVDSHIHRLHCRFENDHDLYRPQCKSETDHLQTKITNLQVLRENLASTSVRVVTLSCCKTDDGLNRLRDVVVMSLRPPEILPVRWCRAINCILNPNVDCLYIRIEEVKRICGDHFTEADDSNALNTILRYLAKTSQIIWLEDHPLLHDYIFHSPQKIIDACKRIIHHDNVVSSSLYCTELREYEKGILLEPLLRELLSAPTENVHLGKEQSASKGRHADNEKVIVTFLQHFNLISYVRTHVKGKQFIVPCKLTLTEPQEKLQELEKRGSACFNRVSVRLTFVGSIIPLSLFETSLSSMLTVAGELSRHLVWPNVWKDGAIISHNGVIFFTKRIDDVIILTAFSEMSETSSWTILHPILKRLNDYIMTSWHGALPTCAIVCPWCVRYGHHNAKVAEIEIDLPTLVAEDGPNNEMLTCEKCLKAVPRSLCFPTREAGLYITHQREIENFFSNGGQPSDQGQAHATSTDSRLIRELDGMEQQQLQHKFRKNYDLIIGKLTFPETRKIVSALYSRKLVISEEMEDVLLPTNTPTAAAQKLVDYISKKNEKKHYCAFIEILENIPSDLVAVLTSLDK